VENRVRYALTHDNLENCAVVDLAFAGLDDAAAAQIPIDLAELCERIACEEQVRVVVLSFDGTIPETVCCLSGTGRRGDVPSLVTPIAGLRQPVIAAIRGDAIGLGLELALACDLRIGMERTHLGLPQIQHGQMPCNGGTQRLPRILGQGRALRMILTGELIRVEDACRLGLIHRIVSPENLMQEAVGMAREMAEKSPVSLSYAKEALYKGMDLTLEQGIRMEMDLYLHLFTTADRTEGITAYKSKRKPKFEGV